jgi:hypothetical protein
VPFDAAPADECVPRPPRCAHDLLACRHGLRAAEEVDQRWEQFDLKTATLHVRRVKNRTIP